jgi:dephospho-CoA kinase
MTSKTLPRIVSLVGMAGVGKSEAVRALLALHPYNVVYFGGVVLEEVKARNLPPGEGSERAMRIALRNELGMAAMAIKSRPHIDALRAEGKPVLIDGLYSYSELVLLRDVYGDALTTIAVHADRSVRARRLAARPERPLSAAEMAARDKSEIEQIEKAAPIAIADFHVLNNGDLAALQREMARIEAIIAG